MIEHNCACTFSLCENRRLAVKPCQCKSQHRARHLSKHKIK